jgi:hypothetical protein
MQETIRRAAQDVCESLDYIDRTLSTKADGTNWTVADSLSNIAFQLERIADALEKK